MPTMSTKPCMASFETCCLWHKSKHARPVNRNQGQTCCFQRKQICRRFFAPSRSWQKTTRWKNTDTTFKNKTKHWLKDWGSNRLSTKLWKENGVPTVYIRAKAMPAMSFDPIHRPHQESSLAHRQGIALGSVGVSLCFQTLHVLLGTHSWTYVAATKKTHRKFWPCLTACFQFTSNLLTQYRPSMSLVRYYVYKFSLEFFSVPIQKGLHLSPPSYPFPPSTGLAEAPRPWRPASSKSRPRARPRPAAWSRWPSTSQRTGTTEGDSLGKLEKREKEVKLDLMKYCHHIQVSGCCRTLQNISYWLTS